MRAQLRTLQRGMRQGKIQVGSNCAARADSSGFIFLPSIQFLPLFAFGLSIRTNQQTGI
jgi:hypothetical protein